MFFHSYSIPIPHDGLLVTKAVDVVYKILVSLFVRKVDLYSVIVVMCLLQFDIKVKIVT
jgi:hypothetical protein